MEPQMLDVPERIQNLIDLINRTSDQSIHRHAYKLLWNAVRDYGMRWEFFV